MIWTELDGSVLAINIFAADLQQLLVDSLNFQGQKFCLLTTASHFSPIFN